MRSAASMKRMERVHIHPSLTDAAIRAEVDGLLHDLEQRQRNGGAELLILLQFGHAQGALDIRDGRDAHAGRVARAVLDSLVGESDLAPAQDMTTNSSEWFHASSIGFC